MNRQLIFTIIFILILGIAGYGFYLYAPSTITPAGTDNSSVELTQRLSDLRKLKNSRIDTSVFQDPVYKALQYSQETAQFQESNNGGTPPPLTSQPGRANPFNPFQ